MLDPYQIYLIFPIIGAICGAMLWLSYFKRIDVLEHERVIDVIIAFVIGFLTPTIALWLYLGLEISGINFNGQLLNDFLYSILGVGVIEELSKLFGVLIIFKLLKKRINEPIDYIVFAGIVALGFSVRENFIYYNNHGSQIATGRTLISCLVHIINTSICVYGLYRYRIFHKGNTYINSLVGISTAVISHGLFDFFLGQPFLGNLTPFISTIIYLVGINFWIQIINNAINFSPFFNYEKIASATKLYTTIFTWYFILLVLEFSYVYYYKDLSFAIKDTLKNLFHEGFLLIIVALRASRLKINKRKYFPVKIQLPFHYTKNDDEDFSFLGIPIKIRGENEKEFQFLKYMGRDIIICPLYKNKSVLHTDKRARLLKKYFLKNDVVTYLIEVYNENNKPNSIYLLKPKTRSITYVDNQYPIATLMYYENPAVFQQEHETLSYKELKGIEKVYIKTII
ncbi:MAG: PrsW family intramembrane metalloprotease [Bacteroidetes bacterium]|nr:PrsW family intramembrane metalloprotease [Bacteroidota bacterium]